LLEQNVQVNKSFNANKAAYIVQKASEFKCRISLIADEKTANAKSIMGIISMDLKSGKNVKIVADGEDANNALSILENIIGGD